MPRFDTRLSREAAEAVSIALAGEIAHTSGSPVIRKEWSITRLEALYELAYLKTFSAWETCLESIFYRSLCGYASSAGQEVMLSGRYYPNLTAAETAVLAGRSYLLWHDPKKVITRCRSFISSASGCPCLQETTINSNLARLTHFSATRHRIVHDQSDAKAKFDAATLAIAGRTYAASRPGKFLRDWNILVLPQSRWLQVLATELSSLARQMV